MSDQCFSSRLLSDFQQFLCFMHSHPLYFIFLFFFSPYLIKLLSFLSPLFITTALILLVFLTGFVHDKSTLQPLSEPKLGFLFLIYNAVAERLRSSNPEIDEKDDDFQQFEELEAFKIVFDTSSFYGREKFEVSEEILEEKFCQEPEEPLLKSLSSEEKTVEVAWEEIVEPVKEVKNLEGLFKELDDFDDMKFNSEDEKVNSPSTESDKDEENKKDSSARMVSEAKGCFKDISVEISTDNGGEYKSKVVTNSVVFYEIDNHVESPSKVPIDVTSPKSPPTVSGLGLAQPINSPYEETTPKTMAKSRNISTDNGGEYTSKFFDSPSSRAFDANLGAYGSMRRDKEWKRTLACKLFEERHNASGSPDGMDSLWEMYETDRNGKAGSKSDKMSKYKKKEEPECDDDDDYDEGMDAKLCCLQALKFSTGKMNMGMGRPNLMKFTKAIKGMGKSLSMARRVK